MGRWCASGSTSRVFPRFPSSLDVRERQRTGRFPVDVREAVFVPQSCRHQHLSGVTNHDRITRKRNDGTANELWRFGVAQVQPLCRLHDLLRAN